MDHVSPLHSDEPTDPTREWNSQPTEAHFKSSTSPPKTIPVVSAIMGRLNHHSIDNSDVDFHPSEFLAESNYESVPDHDITLGKLIYDDEIYHLL